MNPMLVLRRRFLPAVVLTLASLVTHAAGPRLDETHASVQAALAVQKDVTGAMMRTPSVLGTAIGVGAGDQAVLVVYIEDGAEGAGAALRAIPPALRGVPVRVEMTDKFRAYPGGGKGGGGGGGTSGNTGKQAPPVSLGTSGGWSYDLANGYCCGGTLGSLITANGIQYMLSNYHVLEADIVAGGNGLVATTGQPVIQPALIDVGCNASTSQAVGVLVTLGALPGSNCDAAIAQVLPGMVHPDGAILGIGALSSAVLPPALKLPVKKSGRTTGLTTSAISGLNATISVAYDNECAGGAAFTKTFTGQIVVTNAKGAFLKSGDSGSLLVENVATAPRAVGLLFAGSRTSAIANPIDEVLEFIGTKLGAPASMVGQ